MNWLPNVNPRGMVRARKTTLIRMTNQRWLGENLLALGEMAIAVLHHNDCRIHQYADGKREAAQGHDVAADLEVIHRQEARHQRDGQSQNRDQRRAEVKEENNRYQADDNGF